MSKPTGKKKVIIAIVVVLIIAAGSGIWKWNESKNSISENSPITIHAALNGGLNVLQLVKDRGTLEEALKKYNVTVEWSEFASGPPLLESLTAKRVDFSFLGDGAALTGQGAGLDFQNIGLISEGLNFNTLLVRPDSGIKDPTDLKGKKITVVKGTTTHVYLSKFLKQYGLEESDVSVVNLSGADGLAAFQSDQVDALVTIDPSTTQLIDQGEGIELKPKEPIKAPLTLIVRNEFGEAYPDIVTEILKVYKATAEWQDQNPDEAAVIYGKLKNLDPAFVKVLIAKQNQGLSPISEEIITTQQESADFLLNAEFLRNPIQYRDYVNNTFVEAALKKE